MQGTFAILSVSSDDLFIAGYNVLLLPTDGNYKKVLQLPDMFY